VSRRSHNELAELPPGGRDADQLHERAILALAIGRWSQVESHEAAIRSVGPDLYDPAHRRLHAALIEALDAGEAVDVATVGGRLHGQDVGLAVGATEQALDLLPANMETHLAAVRSNAAARHLSQATRQVMTLRGGDRQAAVDDAQAALDELRSGGARPTDAVLTRSMAEVEERRIEWLWTDMVPRGFITVMIGAPKSGKSSITRALATALSTGTGMPRPAGGEDPAGEPAASLFAIGEDTAEEVLKPCFCRAGANLEKIHVLDGRGEGDTPWPWRLDDVEGLDRAIERNGARLVVVDPWQAFLPAGVDAHRMDDVRAVLDPLRRLAARRAIALVLVTHPNKAAGGEVHRRVNGSGDVVAIARSVLAVAKREGGSIVAQAGTNLARPDLPGLAFRVCSDEVTAEGRERMSASWVEWLSNRTDARDLLAGEGPTSAEDREDRDEAASFLKEALKDGPRMSKEMQLAAADAGIPARAMKNARRKLDVLTKRVPQPGHYVHAMALPCHADLLDLMATQKAHPSGGQGDPKNSAKRPAGDPVDALPASGARPA